MSEKAQCTVKKIKIRLDILDFNKNTNLKVWNDLHTFIKINKDCIEHYDSNIVACNLLNKQSIDRWIER